VYRVELQRDWVGGFDAALVEDFVKRMSLVEFSAEGLRAVGPDAILLAELEGLFAHAQAVRLRMEDVE